MLTYYLPARTPKWQRGLYPTHILAMRLEPFKADPTFTRYVLRKIVSSLCFWPEIGVVFDPSSGLDILRNQPRARDNNLTAINKEGRQRSFASRTGKSRGSTMHRSIADDRTLGRRHAREVFNRVFS